MLYETYLNIYSGDPGDSLEAIMEKSEIILLHFSPYKLNYAVYGYETQKKVK